MSRYHLPMQWMSNFKAVAIDYEYYLTLEDTGRLYCLTDREIYILMSQVEAYIGWLTRWYNTEDITQPTVQFIQSDLLEDLMSCVDIQILIDQAKITANYEATNQQIQSEAVRQILIDRYDGTPESINPSAPTTNFGSSGDRYDALCASITAFVYKFAANQANVIRLNEVGGAAAIALIAAMLIPGLNIFLLVGAGIAVLLGFGVIGVSSETAIAALTDQAALNDVICFMRDTLASESVTEAHWNACLDSYPFGVGTHQAIDADFIKATLADNYLSVLNMLGQGYDSVLAGDELPECPCFVCPTFGLDTSIWNSGNGVASGIMVTSGTDYHADIPGTYIYSAFLPPVNADGNVMDFTPITIDPAVNDLRVIAKVGVSGSWFPLGVSTDFTAAASGELYMTVNDVNAAINFADNVGTLTVTVCPA